AVDVKRLGVVGVHLDEQRRRVVGNAKLRSLAGLPTFFRVPLHERLDRIGALPELVGQLAVDPVSRLCIGNRNRVDPRRKRTERGGEQQREKHAELAYLDVIYGMLVGGETFPTALNAIVPPMAFTTLISTSALALHIG